MIKRIHRFISLVIVGSFANFLIGLLFASSLNSNLVSAQQLRPNDPPPQSAYIEKVCHQVPDQSKCKEIQTKYVNIMRGENPQGLARPGDNVYLDRKLLIEGKPSIGAMLGFKSKRTGKPIKGYLAAAGFSSRTTQYFYPCQIEGGKVLMGWTPESPERCKEIRYHSTTLIGPKVESRAKTSKQSQLHQSIISFTEKPKDFLNLSNQKLEIAQSGGAPVYYRQYCSAAKDAGGEWKVELADFTYTDTDNRPNDDVPLTSAEDVCNKAVLACEGDEVGSCSVFSYGNWIANSSQPINLTLTCSNPTKVYYRRGREQRTARLEQRLEEVKKLKNDLEQEARGDKAESCVFDIYSDGDVSIKPSDQQRTWIYTNSTEKGFTIDVLVGEASIKPLREKSVAVVNLKAGQRYEYLRPQARSLTSDEKKQISEEPIIQEFITCSNWQDWGVNGICDELNQYRKALQQFYQPPQPPAASVKELVINGKEVWKATVDLTDPGVLVTLRPSANITASNFGQFAKQQQAALIMGGTYKKGTWTFRSEQKTLSSGSRLYTVLTLSCDNRPDMITLTDSGSRPDLINQSCFALQAGPRLLREGRATVTQKSKTDEGHTLNIYESSRRAGIGFSQDGKKLYYVVAKNVTIPELARIMASKEIGSWAAMNLDGGDGPALAENGIVRELAGAQAQPYMIVVYDRK